MLTWVPAISVEVPGVPVAKGRPRFKAYARNRVKVYADAKTKRYEEAVAVHVAAHTRGKLLAPAGTPVRLDVLAVYPRPQRLNRVKDPSGLIPKCNKHHGDLDNHVKAVMDGINQAGLWDDDGQVQCIRAEAVYAEKGQRPRTRISVFLRTQETGQ